MPEHQPYVPATQSPAELTPRALLLGVLLGLIFSASSVYLALKIGLTVSSSIPIAVLSITIFRALGRTSILENNIVQTTGSASDSVAAGVVFTIPAILLMGYDLDISRGMGGFRFGGGCLAYMVLAPAIKLVGSGLVEPFGFPAVKLIRDMSPSELRASFVFYIGAGAVASAGIIALARSLPTILSSFASSWKELRASRLGQAVTRLRTEDDLPLSLTVGGSIALAVVLTLLPQLGVNLLGAVLIVIFGFFFATVSSRICGQIGSSANPLSGMTIAALLGTCLIFVAIGWTDLHDRVPATSIAAVVAVATANAGNTSQDLKTGFLVGSTPRRQQIAILVGALGSALVVGWTLTLLNRSFTYPVPEAHAAFSAQSLTPPAGGRAPVEVLPATMSSFRVAGGDSVDRATYQVVRVYVVTQGVAAGKYLMDPATHQLRYVLDPGIGGRIRDYCGPGPPPPPFPQKPPLAPLTPRHSPPQTPPGAGLFGRVH